ncbi:MAG: protein kinase [bacterium]|nr:protein kinase [bacterium]
MFEQISDTYTVLGLIGSGGAGQVYKAYHKRLQKEVVIKKIHSNVQAYMNVRAEADILKSLRHSYLPQVLDYLVIDGEVYTVMDYIPGKSFEQLLSEGVRFYPKDVLKWARQLADAVAYLHAQQPPIIHGDIKPDNLMLMPNGDICLIDFNISGVQTGNKVYAVGYTDGYSPIEQYQIVYVDNQLVAPIENNMQQQGSKPISHDTEMLISKELQVEQGKTEILGNILDLEGNRDATEMLEELPRDVYSPDDELKKQAAKQKTVQIAYSLIDSRSDVYSMGATIYHLLTGRKPESAVNQNRIPLEAYGLPISDGLVYIVDKAMQNDPNQRFASAKEMLEALKNVAKVDRRYKHFIMRTRIGLCSLAALLAIGCVLVTIGTRTMEKEREEEYEASVQCLKNTSEEGNEVSQSDFDDATKLYSKRLAPYYYKILGLYQAGKYKEAVKFQTTVPADVDMTDHELSGNYNFIIANCYFEQEQYEQSIPFFKEAVAYHKENPEYYRDYAIALTRMGQKKKAAKILETAIKYGLINNQVCLVQGEIALAESQYETGEKALQDCISLTTDDYIKMRAYLKLSDLYEDAWNKNVQTIGGSQELVLDKDVSILKEAKDKLPIDKTSAICEKLAQAYARSGAYYNDTSYTRKAVEVYNDMITFGWKTYETYYNLSVLNQQLGEFAAANDAVMELKKQYGEDYVIYKRLALLEADQQAELANIDRNYETFEEYYKKAVEMYQGVEKDRSDPEMDTLRSMHNKLINGGWINE